MHTPRRKKLVQPGFQLRLIGRFAGLAALAMLLQFGLLAYYVMRSTDSLGEGGGELAARLPAMLLTVLALSAVIVAPIIFFVGLHLTHRIAGPIQRIEAFLDDVNAGTQAEPFALRDGDEMQQLLDGLNEATAAKRKQNSASAAPARDASSVDRSAA